MLGHAMKVVLPGGAGFLGTLLARDLSRAGSDVVVLSRTADATKAWRVLAWDARSLGAWADEIDGADAVINLAGRSVNCRYGAENRREIVDSRVLSTRIVGEAIARAKRPPRAWLQMNTATIYAHRFDAPNDEATGTLGGGEPGVPETWRFSIEVATAWERELELARVAATRKVALRTAVVMGAERGTAFDILLGLVRHGLGGRSGDGRQFVSWMHEDDFVRAIRWILEHEELAGPVNLASPSPVPNAQLMRELREAWGIRFGLPAPAWLLEIGAVLIRTETELILKSRRVVPRRLLDSGFTFEHAEWSEAARDLVARWRAAQPS